MHKYLLNIIILSLLFLQGCLKDNPVEYPKVNIENATELLTYLEASGDYINSPEMPALVECEEIYDNINSYLIIDVRTKEKYLSGHIKGSINITSDSLWIFLETNNSHIYPKVILVSETGQSASYYCCLLRLGGFSNVYSMNFGMSYWHIDFADKWINSISDFILGTQFNNVDYPKNPFSPLPDIAFTTEGNIQLKVENRIQQLLAQGFPEDSVAANVSYISNTIIALESAADLIQRKQDIYLACYGPIELYKAGKTNDPFPEQGHFPNTAHYIPEFDLMSVNNLQTFPLNKIIAVYDFNGQTSASVTAYLRLLGYNAKSILFGANKMFYSRLSYRQSDFAFNVLKIRNFEYEK